MLIGNSDFRDYTIGRDLELEGLLISHAQNFWHEHVLSKTPPEPTNLQDAAVLFPKEAPDSSVQADESILKSIQAYKESCSKSQKLSEECERLKLEILSYMGHAERLNLGNKTLATWKCAKSSQRIDTKALALAHPDIALAFTSSVMGSRRFLLKDAS